MARKPCVFRKSSSPTARSSTQIHYRTKESSFRQTSGEPKQVRRSSAMRNRLIGLVFVLLAAPAFSPFVFAQTADQQGMAKAELAASGQDLSGLWIRLRDPSHSPINLDFGQAISPMTPWA